MGGKTSTSTSSTTIPADVLARYNSVNATAEKTAQTPFQQYSTDPNAFVAPLSATQNAGIANTNAAANEAQPYYGAATGATIAGMQNADPGALNTQQYMNPYLSNVVGATEAQMQNQNAQQQSALQGSAIQAGAFGGDRSGIAAGNLANQQNLANNQVIGNLLNSGYTQAQGVAQQQQGLGLSAQQANLQRMMAGGQQLAGLGSAAQGSALQGAQAQLTAGQQEQQTNQAGKSALYNQFLQQQSYPFQTAQFLANIAEGTGALSGSTTSTTSPTPFFSDERLKEDIEPIGKTFDGQNIVKFRYKGKPETHIGLIAQDVEKHHPRAVGLAGGFRTVDYDEATRHAAERGHYRSGGLVPNSMGGAVDLSHSGEHFADGGMPSSIDTTGTSPYGGTPPRFQVNPLVLRQLMQSHPVQGQNQNGMTQLAQLMSLGQNASTLYNDGKTAINGVQNYFGNQPQTHARGGRAGYDNGGALPYGNDNADDPNSPNYHKPTGLNIPNQSNQYAMKTPQNPTGLNPQGNQFKNAADTVKNIYGIGQGAASIANLVAPAALGTGAATAATGATGGLGSLLALIPFLASGGAAKRHHFDDGGTPSGGSSGNGDTGGGSNPSGGDQSGGGGYGAPTGNTNGGSYNPAMNDPANYNGMNPAPSDYGSPAGVSAMAYDNMPSDMPTPPVRPAGLGYNSSLDSGGDTALTNAGPNNSVYGTIGNGSTPVPDVSSTAFANGNYGPVTTPDTYGGLTGGFATSPNYGDTAYTNAGTSSPYGDLSTFNSSNGNDVSPTAFAKNMPNVSNYGSLDNASPTADLANLQGIGNSTLGTPDNVPAPIARPAGLGNIAPTASSSDGNNLNPDTGLTDQTARDIAIRTILAEGGTIDPSSMPAIGAVLINRYNQGYNGNDYNNVGEVATQPSQFSAWNGNNVGTANDPRSFDLNSDAYQAAAAVYDGLVNGTIADPTNGAMMYANPALTNAGWVRQMQNSGNYVTIGAPGHQQIYGNLTRATGGLVPHKSTGGPLADIPASSRVYIPPAVRAKQEYQQQQNDTKPPLYLDNMSFARGGLVPRMGYDAGGAIQSDDPSLPNYVPSPADMKIYYKNAAEDNGVDPATAAKVFNIESGFKAGAQGDNNTSFGVTQLHKGGLDPRYPNSGMGDQFQQQTGKDPSDPRNWQAQADWTMSQVPQTGWTPWQTTQNKLGLSKWAGINGNPADMPSQNAVNAGPADFPDNSNGNPISNAYDSAKGWLGDTGNRNLALSVLSGLGHMAGSNSRYLGAAMLQGLGGGADTYAGLQKQAADIAQTQAQTGNINASAAQTQAGTRGIDIENVKRSMEVTPAGNIIWLANGKPMPAAEYYRRTQNGENLPTLGRIPSKPSDSVTSVPVPANPNAPSPATPNANNAPVTNAPAVPNVPVNYDAISKKTAQSDVAPVISGGINGTSAMERSAKYAEEVRANAQSARNMEQNTNVAATTLADAAGKTGWNTPGAGIASRASWTNIANTLSRAFGGNGTEFGTADTSQQIMDKLNTLKGSMAASNAGQNSLQAFNALEHANPNLSQNPAAQAELTSRVLTMQQRSIDQENHMRLYGQDSGGNFTNASNDFERSNPIPVYNKEASVLQELMLQNPAKFSMLMKGQVPSNQIDTLFQKKYGLAHMSRYFNGGS